MDQCTGLTIHTKKAVIIMMTSDVYKEGNFRFIGIMSPEGNGFFMQSQLLRVISSDPGPGIISASKTYKKVILRSGDLPIKSFKLTIYE